MPVFSGSLALVVASLKPWLVGGTTMPVTDPEEEEPPPVHPRHPEVQLPKVSVPPRLKHVAEIGHLVDRCM